MYYNSSKINWTLCRPNFLGIRHYSSIQMISIAWKFKNTLPCLNINSLGFFYFRNMLLTKHNEKIVKILFPIWLGTLEANPVSDLILLIPYIVFRYVSGITVKYCIYKALILDKINLEILPKFWVRVPLSQ